MSTLPQGKTATERLAILAQRLVIRKNDQNGESNRIVPTVEEFVEALRVLVEREYHQARLDTVMKIFSEEATNRGRNLYMLEIAKESREMIADCDKRAMEDYA
jgi:L-lactate utilization protein LutB